MSCRHRICDLRICPSAACAGRFMARKPPSEAAYPSHFSVFLAALGARKPRCPGVRHRPTLRAAGSRERLRRSAEARARGCAASHEPLRPQRRQQTSCRPSERGRTEARPEKMQAAKETASEVVVSQMAPPRGQAAFVPRRAAHKGLDRVPQRLAALIGRQVAEETARAPLVPRIAPPSTQAAFAPRRGRNKGLGGVPEAPAAATRCAVCKQTAQLLTSR